VEVRWIGGCSCCSQFHYISERCTAEHCGFKQVSPELKLAQTRGLNWGRTLLCLALRGIHLWLHTSQKKAISFWFSFAFLCLEVLGFEFSNLSLLGKCSTTWAMSPVFFALVIFHIGSWHFSSWVGLRLWPSASTSQVVGTEHVTSF
jgi:hypothetical protein